MRVLAAMSGGVDSSVVAARVAERGHEVVGVHLALSARPGTLRTGARGCCTKEDAGDARRVADVIGVPFYVWDFAEQFSAEVVHDFVAEYAAGRTPNPCLRCNERIKFTALLDRALALGFDAVCTGHYARLSGGVLRRGADAGKDQSYVLAGLRADQLAHALFPVGDATKAAIRAEAARRGLAVAGKPDSHDICFIPSGDTRAFLTDRLGSRPGELIDARTGEILGSHGGVHGFTVGQRRGLGLERPASDGQPRFVLGLEPVTGTVRVGSAGQLDVHVIDADRAVWASGTPEAPLECVAQVRAHGGCAVALAEAHGDRVRVQLRAPLRGVAPGQAIALYRPDPDGDVVLGSATITTTHSAGDGSAHPSVAEDDTRAV